MGLGAALYGAEDKGPDLWAKMQAMARMQAAQRGQADLVNSVLNSQQPTAMNPPPGQPSVAARPPAAGGTPGGPPPAQMGQQFTGAAPVAPQQTDGVSGVIPPSIRQFIIDLKRQNPQAKPDEIMAALDQALPWMTAQQKQDLETMKQQLGFAKFEMGEKDKDRTAGQRDQQLAINKKRADAYVKYLESKPGGKVVSQKAKAIQAKINVYQTQLNQMMGGGQGAPTPSSPDYAKFQWLQGQVQKGKQALSYLYNAANAVPPPPEISDQLYQDAPDQPDDSQDTSGGDTSGGQ